MMMMIMIMMIMEVEVKMKMIFLVCVVEGEKVGEMEEFEKSMLEKSKIVKRLMFAVKK